MTQPFSYRKSLLANKARVAQLRAEGDKKQARKHKRKRRLYLQQRGLCCFCKRKMFLDSAHCISGLLATREHVVPKSHGGKDILDNLKISCARCNNKRGSKEFELFHEIVKNHLNSKFGILAKTGTCHEKRGRRYWNMMAEAYWVLDGGEHKNLKTGKTSKSAKKHKANYNLYAFTSAMNAMDETRARMGLTLSNS